MTLALPRMQIELSLGIPKDTQSLTPATQDTVSLESGPELVSPPGYGQGIFLHVWVSSEISIFQQG